MPFVRPLVKFAGDAGLDGRDPGRWSTRRSPPRRTPHTGPAFVDLPLDHVFMNLEERVRARGARARRGSSSADARRARRAPSPGCARPSGPVIMAGTNLYWGRAEAELRRARRGARHPRLPQRPRPRLRARRPRPRLLARAQRRRSRAPTSRSCIGVPMDFRLGFGASFGEETEIIVADVAEPEPRAPARRRRRALRRPARDADRAARGRRRRLDTAAWVAQLRARRGREAGRRARAARRRPRAAAPDARVRRPARGDGPRRDRRSSTPATSAPTPAASSRPTSPAAGSTPARTAASAPAPATRSPPSSPTPTARSS